MVDPFETIVRPMTDGPPDPSGAMASNAALDLADWRRRIFELYAQVRASADPRAAFDRWRAVRDVLFADHPSSPIPATARAGFGSLSYFDHDPEARVLAQVEPASPMRLDVAASGGGSFSITRIARVGFELHEHKGTLDLFWMEGYAGGLFLPFADETSGRETYGAGRYLVDSSKGADLGQRDGGLVLDFNLAYSPSCAYDPSWVCPLAPPGNRLAFPVRAGERVSG